MLGGPGGSGEVGVVGSGGVCGTLRAAKWRLREVRNGDKHVPALVEHEAAPPRLPEEPPLGREEAAGACSTRGDAKFAEFQLHR